MTTATPTSSCWASATGGPEGEAYDLHPPAAPVTVLRYPPLPAVVPMMMSKVVPVVMPVMMSVVMSTPSRSVMVPHS